MGWTVNKNIVLIYLSGGVPIECSRYVLETVNYVVDKLEAHETYIEVYIYEDIVDYVALSGLRHPNIYFVMHEAYMGWPRIHIIFSLSKELDDKVFRAGIIHETIHSIIHGSPKYYMVTPPDTFIHRCLAKLERNLCNTLYNLLASAVKDYEVSTTALKNDIVDEYKPLLHHYLDEVYRDVACYEDDRVEKIVLLGNVVKQVLAAYPYRGDEDISSKTSQIIGLTRERLGIDFSDVDDVLFRFTGDTYRNIIDFVEWFVEKVLDN